jgi:DnaJ-class molecular chaperone
MQLAIIWHPDKHPEGPEREAAAKKFMEIQKVCAGGWLSLRRAH